MQQKHAERARPGRNNQSKRRVQPAQLVEDKIHGHEQNLARNHERGDNERKQPLFTGQFQSRQPIRGQRINGQDEQSDRGRDEYAVGEPASDGDFFGVEQNIAEVLRGDMLRQQAAKVNDFGIRLERGNQHNRNRQHKQQRPTRHQCLNRNSAHPVLPRFPASVLPANAPCCTEFMGCLSRADIGSLQSLYARTRQFKWLLLLHSSCVSATSGAKMASMSCEEWRTRITSRNSPAVR